MAEWRSSSRKRKDRADRQRQAERTQAEAEARHLRAISDSPVFQRVLASEHAAASEILKRNSGHQAVVEAAVDAVRLGDALAHQHLKVLPPERVAACREGCHHCCHIRVQASVPEIFSLAEWLRAHRNDEELRALRSKVSEVAADDRVLSLTEKPKHRIACVLLKDGACSAYEGRPLACRSFTSMDAEACRRALDREEPVVADAFLLRVYNGAGQGLSRALADAGLGTETVELTRGLDIALNETNVFERWSRGEPVFERARVR